MGEEFYLEVLRNIQEYMQDSIDKGYHKFIYNDLGWDVKCVDVIEAINTFIDKEDYIPKSKVREKIGELEDLKLCSDNFYKQITEDKIKVLQELLEERN